MSWAREALRDELHGTLILKVPTMDWSPRQTWHSRLSLRSWQARFQKDDSILLLHLQIQGKRSLAFEDAPAFRVVWEPHSVCHAPMLCGTRKNQPWNTRRPVEQHCRYFTCRTQAILESEESYAGRKHSGYGSLPRNIGSNIRELLPGMPLNDVCWLDSLDYWRTLILPNCLGLDQEMVRPYYYLQNIHPLSQTSLTYINILHRYRKHTHEVRRGIGLWMRENTSFRPTS